MCSMIGHFPKPVGAVTHGSPIVTPNAAASNKGPLEATCS